MSVMRNTIAATIATLALAGLSPQTPQAPALSSAVRAYVSVDAPVIALTHARVIDGTGAAARADQTIVIRDGNIAAIGPAATTPAPAGQISTFVQAGWKVWPQARFKSL